MGQELLGEDLEQRLVADGGDGIFALGAIIAQAGTLAAGDEESADFALAQQFMATGECFGVEGLMVCRLRIAGGG